MPRDGSMTFSFLLPLQWWRRLQRVAATCHTSPRDFVRQIVEAEIVRREMLLKQEGDINPQWLALVGNMPTNSRLQ